MNVKSKSFIVKVNYTEYLNGYEVDEDDIENSTETYLQALQIDGDIESYESVLVEEMVNTDVQLDIISVLQSSVDQIVKEKYSDDECFPTFIVSVLQEHEKEWTHKIAMTVLHKGISHTRVIFPQTNYKFGYPDLREEVEYLYNSTM